MASLFPIFIKLEGRRCLLVGAGTIAQQKLGSLLDSGAVVHVVAPAANDAVRQFAADGRLRWSARAFAPADLNDAFMVIAATGNPAVNEQVFQEARKRGVLCNAVDEPERCDFYYPAIVRRGDLQIAISTAGHSPALAQRLRAELEAWFGPEYSPWLRWLGHVRSLLFRRQLDPQRRRQALHQIASREVYERFARAHRQAQGAR